jgi:hypothetical protein
LLVALHGKQFITYGLPDIIDVKTGAPAASLLDSRIPHMPH